MLKRGYIRSALVLDRQYRVFRNYFEGITISKLYYALYHRILEELPNLQTSKGSNKHESIEKILDKQCCNGNFYVTLAELFKDLKELRVWADYQALSSMPKEVNLSLLQRKTFDKIKSSKLIY